MCGRNGPRSERRARCRTLSRACGASRTTRSEGRGARLKGLLTVPPEVGRARRRGRVLGWLAAPGQSCSTSVWLDEERVRLALCVGSRVQARTGRGGRLVLVLVGDSDGAALGVRRRAGARALEGRVRAMRDLRQGGRAGRVLLSLPLSRWLSGPLSEALRHVPGALSRARDRCRQTSRDAAWSRRTSSGRGGGTSGGSSAFSSRLPIGSTQGRARAQRRERSEGA